MAGGLELPHLERTSLRLYEKNVLGSSVKKIPKQTNNNSKNKTKTPKQTKLPPKKNNKNPTNHKKNQQPPHHKLDIIKNNEVFLLFLQFNIFIMLLLY